MEIGGPVGIVALVVLVGLFIEAGFLLLGARIVSVDNRTYGKALGTTLLGGLATFVLSLLLSAFPMIGNILVLIVSWLIMALIMMPIFSTTFAKAIGSVLIAMILSLVIFGGIAFLLISIFGSFGPLF